MISQCLRAYYVSGPKITDSLLDHASYLASQKAAMGPRASGGGDGATRAQSVGGGMTKSKVGPAIGKYDPEWASWLAEETV